MLRSHRAGEEQCKETHLQWAGAYHPAYRISAALEDAIASDGKLVDVVVQLFEHSGTRQTLAVDPGEIPGRGGLHARRVEVPRHDLSLAGTTVLLHNRTGAGTDNINTVYPDLTASAQSLAALAGTVTAGAWKLKVRDLAAVDTGTLASWELDLRSP